MDASLRQDGKISKVTIAHFEKRYDADGNKFYSYALVVERVDGRVATVYRRFR